MNRLEGKTAIITGAGGGQGAAEAKLFACEGANVVITDINFAGVEETARVIIESGNDNVLALKHDVSLEEDWQKVVEEAVNKFGGK